jgi:hypothetical protein
VGDGAGYGVQAVIVRERTAVFGDVGELVGSAAALDVIAPSFIEWILPPSVSRGGTLQR